jgi:hypothetical protein
VSIDLRDHGEGIVGMSLSLDGFIAALNDSIQQATDEGEGNAPSVHVYPEDTYHLSEGHEARCER